MSRDYGATWDGVHEVDVSCLEGGLPFGIAHRHVRRTKPLVGSVSASFFLGKRVARAGMRPMHDPVPVYLITSRLRWVEARYLGGVAT